MDGCALSLTEGSVMLLAQNAAVTFHSSRCLPFEFIERRDRHPRRADPQSEEYFLRDSARQADGGQRRVWVGQELACVRHDLRGGAATVCGVALSVCSAVSGA